jgi:hypothetical protein
LWRLIAVCEEQQDEEPKLAGQVLLKAKQQLQQVEKDHPTQKESGQ